jgi:hypothetical protein
MENLQFLFWFGFGLVVIYLVSRISKYGFKGAFFGAKIDHMAGEVEGAKVPLMTMKLKVHVLAPENPDRAVGIELTQASFASWRTVPIALSLDQTKKLVGVLQTAIAERERMPTAKAY